MMSLHARMPLRFSALQRAEIAEMVPYSPICSASRPVSVLFNEPKLLKCQPEGGNQDERSSFSALQRAEIAEMCEAHQFYHRYLTVSVLFNEPKLLKSSR